MFVSEHFTSKCLYWNILHQSVSSILFVSEHFTPKCILNPVCIGTFYIKVYSQSCLYRNILHQSVSSILFVLEHFTSKCILNPVCIGTFYIKVYPQSCLYRILILIHNLSKKAYEILFIENLKINNSTKNIHGYKFLYLKGEYGSRI